MLKPMEAHTEDAQAEEEAARLSVGVHCTSGFLQSYAYLGAKQVKIAVYASLYANFALCIIQRKRTCLTIRSREG